MSLSIVIVNYNSEELLKNCLDTIFRSTLKDIEVIVVDNSPNHRILTTTLSQYPHIKQVNSDYNSGFGRANNLGAKIADKDFLLFLNPDIILNADTLEICLREFSSNKKAGILACQLKFENSEIQESRSYNIFNLNEVLMKSSLYTKYFKRKIIKGPIESLTGCFLLTSKDIFNNVNGFDPDFFMYSEEFDLCQRIKKLDKELLFIETVSCIHIGGATIENNFWSEKQKIVSHYLFFYKHKGFLYYLLIILIDLFTHVSNFIIYPFIRKIEKRNNSLKAVTFLLSLKYIISIPFLFKRRLGESKRLLKI